MLISLIIRVHVVVFQTCRWFLRGGGGGAQPPDSHQYFLSLGIVLFGRVRGVGYNEHVRSREVVLRMQCGLTECSMNVQQVWPDRERCDIGVNT